MDTKWSTIEKERRTQERQINKFQELAAFQRQILPLVVNNFVVIWGKKCGRQVRMIKMIRMEQLSRDKKTCEKTQSNDHHHHHLIIGTITSYCVLFYLGELKFTQGDWKLLVSLGQHSKSTDDQLQWTEITI